MCPGSAFAISSGVLALMPTASWDWMVDRELRFTLTVLSLGQHLTAPSHGKRRPGMLALLRCEVGAGANLLGSHSGFQTDTSRDCSILRDLG